YKVTERFLDERFPRKWIGCERPITWPTRSPDLNPLDFYLWGHLKAIMYSAIIASVEVLHTRI
ncbi:hypothetical protein EAG_15359, partial [Camponotus floridanus]